MFLNDFVFHPRQPLSITKQTVVLARGRHGLFTLQATHSLSSSLWRSCLTGTLIPAFRYPQGGSMWCGGVCLCLARRMVMTVTGHTGGSGRGCAANRAVRGFLNTADPERHGFELQQAHLHRAVFQ